MIHVACLRWGNKYPAHYVNRLYNAVQRNVSYQVSFHCFTDEPDGINPDINIIPLLNIAGAEQVSGWWFKPYMFASTNYLQNLEGQVFYLDLDTLITGDISSIMRTRCEKDELIILRDFFKPGTENFGSGVMKWNCGDHAQIWDTFIKDPLGIAGYLHPHGDQVLIQQVLGTQNAVFWQDIFPGGVVSYKVHNQGKPITEERIICFHGRPSIPQAMELTEPVQAPQGMVLHPAPWIRDHWVGGTPLS